MKLTDVNAINDYTNITEEEHAMKARNLSGWTLYYHHYSKNKQIAEGIVIELYRTGREIVSIRKSSFLNSF